MKESEDIDFKSILTELGYKLDDRGDYWQTNALYRGGDNRTAIQIYKDTGVWKDYVEESPFLPFKALIEKSCEELGGDATTILKNLSLEELTSKKQDVDKVKVDEIYSNKEIEKLLPHFDFYNKKNIGTDLLKSLKCGLSTQGQMYQRFVFPIHNEYKQIIGFAGRDMTNKPNRPKWKHIGKKTKWCYPIHSPDFEPHSQWHYENIILVESIGDFLSLTENTKLNSLVTFGLDISPALINALLSICPKRIFISTNNDYNSKENRGLYAAIKNYLKLLKFFDFQKIKICLPTQNDFGDMNNEDYKCWLEKLKNIKDKDQRTDIIKQAKSMFADKKLSKALYSQIKIIS